MSEAVVEEEKGTKLFVGGVSWETTDGDLHILPLSLSFTSITVS